MGLDFIRRRAKTFTKTWSRGRTDLAQPTLFTRYPECRSRSVLLLVRGTTQIGSASSPPPDLMAAICKAGGNALGQVARINPISGTADVEVE